MNANLLLKEALERRALNAQGNDENVSVKKNTNSLPASVVF